MTTIHRERIILRRLLKKKEITVLFEDFEKLMPGVELALIGADGKLFVGIGEWLYVRVILEDILTLVDDAQPVQTDSFTLYPLIIDTKLVAALTARGIKAEQENILRCLHRSLSMLLAQAIEKRGIAQELLERYREINMLYNIGETISTRLNVKEIPQLVLDEAERVIQADIGLVILLNNTSLEVKTKDVAEACLGKPSYIEILHKISRPTIEHVLNTGQPAIITEFDDNPGPISSVLCAPLKTQGEILGIVLLGKLVGRDVFAASDEKLLMALSSQTAITIEKARLHQQEIQQQRLEEELAVGHRIQLSLLPETCPSIPGWEFSAYYQSARQVGGDFYDFFELPGDSQRLGMVIGDVTGKGVPAALFMAFSRAIIRTESMSGRNPAKVFKQANKLLFRDNRSRLYLSTFYATLDTNSGQLTFANAGHNWPLWWKVETRSFEELEARGIVLGAFEEIDLEERSIDILSGDLLIFCTDGVTEAMNKDGEMFDDERLRHTVSGIARNGDGSAENVLQAIVKAVKKFTGDTPQSDDFTLFVVKRKV